MASNRLAKTLLASKSLRLLNIALDGIGAVSLFFLALLTAPLRVLNPPLACNRSLSHLSLLSRQGLLLSAVRVYVHWKHGRFSVAITQGEILLRQIEDHHATARESRVSRQVLIDAYTLLLRAHLQLFNINSAMSVVVRAKKNLGKDYLKSHLGLDAKTAQLIMAGLSASRLLENDGLAALFIKRAKKSKDENIRSRKNSVKRPPQLFKPENSNNEKPNNLIRFPQNNQCDRRDH